MKKIALSRDDIVDMVRAGAIKIQEGALLVKLLNGSSLSTGELASQVQPFSPLSARAHSMRIRSALLAECSHLFLDEPELEAAWRVGVAEQREAFVGLDEITRAAAQDDAMSAGEAEYYDQVERDFWDDVYDDRRSQELVS